MRDLICDAPPHKGEGNNKRDRMCDTPALIDLSAAPMKNGEPDHASSF
jgi:hypothetical protein